MKKIFLFFGLLLSVSGVWGQFPLMNTTYTQDFNTLANGGTSSTLPTGWSFNETGTASNTTYTAGTGSIVTGDTYSFGPAPTAPNTERALGGLRSGALIPVFGFNFTNNTGSAIISINLAYSGETWRVGAVGRSDRLDFQYSLTATSLTNGTWIDFNPLDYANPAGEAVVGGSLQHTASLSALITGLSLLNGSSFFIRWTDLDASGSDDGMGVDDLRIIVTNGIPAPVGLLNFAGQKENNQNILRWATASESNNKGFEVQRSNDGINYNAIGFVDSKANGGNSTSELNYSFVDNTGGAKQYYRLRQVDLDNRSKNSNIIVISGGKISITKISGLFPNPANSFVNVTVDSYKRDKVTLVVTDLAGKIVKQQAADIETGSNTVSIDISNLNKGNYFVKLVCESNCEMSVSRFIRQ